MVDLTIQYGSIAIMDIEEGSRSPQPSLFSVEGGEHQSCMLQRYPHIDIPPEILRELYSHSG